MKIEVTELELGMIVQGLIKEQRYLESPKCSEAAHESAKEYAELAKRMYQFLVNAE